MARFIAIPPEEIERARILYETTAMPMDDIASLLGITRRTLASRVKLWGWEGRDSRFHGLDEAAKKQIREISEIAGPAIAVAENETLIDRVRAAVEREIVAIEAVLARVEGARLRSSDAERAARTLATLVKTLREVAALQRDEKPETEKGAAEADEFRDLEEFRAELAERLDRLRRERDAS